MIVRFKMDGRSYSRNKDAFKQLLKKYGIFWKGSMQDPWWGSATEKVTAQYERDEARDVTVSATLTWEGETESPFMKEFRAWCLALKAEEITLKAASVKGATDEMMFYDMVFQPQPAYLEASGRPKAWIEKDVERFETERSKRFGGRTSQ